MRKNGVKKMKGFGDNVMLLVLCFVTESVEAFIIVISVSMSLTLLHRLS